jgi:hypothetical protein
VNEESESGKAKKGGIEEIDQDTVRWRDGIMTSHGERRESREDEEGQGDGWVGKFMRG